MGHLLGLQEYLDEFYNTSIFNKGATSKKKWELHLHTHRIISARVVENLKYDLKVGIDEGENEIIPKVSIKLLYPEELSKAVSSLLTTDKKVKGLGLAPILAPGKRYHIKNKSLFPLMKEKKVVFFTLLEGEIVRGVVAGFNRYEITVNLKGGIPLTILRHAIFDVRDKKGRCFLKSFQDKHRDWEKSELFVSALSSASAKGSLTN